MTQHFDSAVAETRPVSVDVPLSERPLIADGENTVISSPDKKTVEPVADPANPQLESLRQRLFPAGGVSRGEESGIRLAHFEIRERIGSGGMGAVFRATDLELARDVALKILHPSSAGDSSLVARFRNEGRACAHLNHDNIARVFYAGSQDGLNFIAYELADGSTIKDLIQQSGRLTPEETINYAIQVTLALNHIAAAGIVHRDIKPSNIMLTESGRVKVVDLGLARRDISDSIGDITVAGTTLGTFDYIAPEQARDPRNADIRSDIYSLGCTMYHMLTGQPPYPEGTALQKLLDHQGKSPPNPRSINAEISPELAAVLRKMMANNPDQRYQAPALLLSDLLHIATLMGMQSIPAEGIIWRKRDSFAYRQPMGAVWVFASVTAICLTAVFLDRFPSSTAMVSSFPPTEFEDLGVPTSEIPTVPQSDGSARSQAESIVSSGTGTETSKDGSVTTERNTTEGPSVNPAVDASRVSRVSVPMPIAALGPLTPAMFQMPMEISGAAGASAAARGEQGPFILLSEAGNRLSFRTLHGAVAGARSGDVILLRYNGYPEEMHSQPPVLIAGMNLIIRSDEGFRPTLEFDGSAGGGVSRTEMFTLRRGTLTIRGIDLRMVTRDDQTSDRWSMFRLDGANRLQLENVSLDCRNSTSLSASLFDFVDAASAGEESAANETSIQLNRVIARGEVDAFRIAGQPQGRIRIQNSAFALAGSILKDLGSASMLQSRGNLQLLLDYSTFILTDSLLHMRDSDELTGRGAQRVLPVLTVRSEACVFASVQPQGRLVFSEGNSFVENIESSFTWNGFTNLYCRYGTMWHIYTAAPDYPGRQLDLSLWKQFWQQSRDGAETSAVELNSTAWVDAAWMSAGAFDPAKAVPGMFQLNTALFHSETSSLPLTRDGLIPGVVVNDLPSFPRLPSGSRSAVPLLESAGIPSVPETPAGIPLVTIPSENK